MKPALLLFMTVTLPAHAGPTADALPNVTVKVGPKTAIAAPVAHPSKIGGRLLSISQGDRKAILQGSSFDIGRQSEVRINYGNTGSATLVRIDGPKTVIEGALNAPGGDVYLLNKNGILFGNGARVNVHGLVASALDLEDSDFLNDLGHLYPITDGNRPAYVWKGSTDEFATTLIQIEPDARIKAQLGGSVLLFAPRVLNQGSIETSEGQVAMAAGSKVYLSFAPDPNAVENPVAFYDYAPDSPYRALAGVLVEVDPHQYQVDVPQLDGDGNPVLDENNLPVMVSETREKTGEVTNDTMGRILAQRGNVTMTSFLVNQNGRVTATTSVNQKGSIRLLARDKFTYASTEVYDANGSSQPQTVISASRAGELNIGAGSVTEILPEGAAGQALARVHLAAAQPGEPAPGSGESSYLNSVLAALQDRGLTLTDEQTFNPPTLEALGKTVTVNDGARIVAPGGHVSLSAQNSGFTFNPSATDAAADTRLYLGKNSLIDASGLKGVGVSLDRNFIEVLLTLNDLRDDPLNKYGSLYREKVWFDIRDLPDSRVADLSGYLKQVPRSISEKLASAGSVVLQSEGDIVQRSGSRVDVSGGSLNYSDGIHKETWLVAADGSRYAIGSAPADTVFRGLLGKTNYLASSERGYTEGQAAGSLTINGFGLALDGVLAGGAIYGERQRESASLGGRLTIGDAAQSGRSAVYKMPGFTFQNGVTPLSGTFTEEDDLPALRAQTVLLDSAMISRSGFENLAFLADGDIRVDNALALQPGTKLSLVGRAISINDDITARGGVINLKSQLTRDSNNYATTGITVAGGVALDVSGLWTNDFLTGGYGTSRIFNKGGSIDLSSAGDVTLASGSLLDVSGGGWLQSRTKLEYGDAGSIAIDSNKGQQLGEYQYKAPQLNGELRGYALGRGGSLAITAPFVTVGGGFGDVREFVATPSFFQSGGFSDFSLTGRDGLLVRAGSVVDVKSMNYQLRSNYLLASSGSHVHDFANRVMLPDYLRSSTSLELSSQFAQSAAYRGIARGSVVVEPGATLRVDSNGAWTDADGDAAMPRIALNAWSSLLHVNGTLDARAGEISLAMGGDPTSASDDGYNAAQAIWLGSSARLLAGGKVVYQPAGSTLRSGTVYDGGTVNIDADKGYLVAENGSLIDVSGVSGVVDTLQYVGGIPRYIATTVPGNAGSVVMDAREGMLVDATFKAGGAGGLGGLLDIGFGRGINPGVANVGPLFNYPGTTNNDLAQKWFVSLSQDAGYMQAGLSVGNSIEPYASGVAHLSANDIMSGGFADVVLGSEYGMRFDGNVTMHMPRSIGIDARLIEGNGATALSAPHVSFSNIDPTLRQFGQFTAPGPLAGTGTMTATAQLLDFFGHTAFSGLSASSFLSSGDIRLTGFGDGGNSMPSGSLLSSGNLTFKSRQLYPTSASDFTISAEGMGGKVTFQGDGAHAPVWSAAGSLTVQATTIEQGGVLKAPFGQISLEATDTLTLKNGSLTSVSAEGATIPFGYTSRDGLDYLYDFGTGSLNLTTLPERVVSLSAPVVNQAGGVVDISGGGDLYAYEWIPGIGGSTDVLAVGAKLDAFGGGTSGVWAIMPANNQRFAAYDTQYWQGADLKAGDAVYLAGVPGLAAGYYTLLPARYGLMPGAMLVSAVSGQQDFSGNAQLRVDGTYLISGHLGSYTANGYVQTGRTAGFVVRPGSDVDRLAEYRDSYASGRFAAVDASRKAADAGRYAIAATTSLALDGVLKSVHASTARGAEVDIAAPKLMVVDQGADGEEGYLAIDESKLAGMNAASLLLGGIRQAKAGSDQVNVLASEVRMGENASLQGPEVILAATDKIQLDAGSSVRGAGNGAGARDLVIGSTSPLIDGDGALVRVSGGAEVDVSRINTDRSRGDLVVENGAILSASGAMLLDATRDMRVDGVLDPGSGAALAMSAGRVSLGSPEGGVGVMDGLWLTESQFNALENASSLSLRSYSSIDLYGSGVFGASTMDLALQAAGVAGYQNDGGTTRLLARNLTLGNDGNALFSAAPALSDGSTQSLGTGNLEISAAAIATGDHEFRLAGFATTILQAAGNLVARGEGTLKADQTMVLEAARISATGGSNQVFEAGSSLTIAALGDAPANSGQTSGGKLAFRGDSVLHQGNIELSGGSVTLEATGTDANDHVILDAGSRIDVSGTTFTLYDQTAPLPAGSVALVSQSGNVEQRAASVDKAAAMIDVSAAPGGHAGALMVKAEGGKAILAGAISATHSADVKGRRGRGAEAELDVGSATLVGDGSLSQALAALQGFSDAQSYRLRNGDAVVGSSDAVQTSRFVLSADNGKVDVAGAIDASGDKGGSIEIYAKNDLTLQRGGQLLARGDGDTASTAGTLGRGGSVTLSSDAGLVKAEVFDADGNRHEDAAEIDVSGDQAGSVKGESGKVILRAARSGLDDIASNAVFAPAITAGTGAAYSAASPGFVLTPGAVVAFQPHTNSTSTTSSLNVQGTGAKALKKAGGASLAAGDLKSGKTYLAVYDGTNYQLVSATSLANGSDAVGSGVKVDAALPAAITGAGEVLVEASRVYEKDTINTAFQKQLAADTVAFASRASSVLSGFSQTRDGIAANLAPGVEVRASNGNLTLSTGSDWNLGSTAFGTIPMTGGGILTLRAAGNLDLKSSIDYEQYTIVSNNPLPRTGSWSYRLVAGSDFAAVNPGSVNTGNGDFTISTNNKFVRTGAGFIDVMAGGDISLNPGAAIYTEGLPDAGKPAGFESVVPNFTLYRELYPDAGGDVRLTAGGSISGNALEGQAVTEWLNRASLRPANTTLANEQLRWWARFDQVKNLVGALGGGDVTVRAGTGLQNLQVAASGSGRIGGDKALSPSLENFSALGGGDVDVRANGDIQNALLFATQGEAKVTTGGQFSGQFALMDGQAMVSATGDISLQRVSNPTATLGAANNNSSDPRSTYFYSYGENAGVHAFSAAGNIVLTGDAVYPASLSAVAPAGDVVTTQFSLYPAPQGNAKLLAGGNLEVRFSMSEFDPASLPKIDTSPVHHTDDLPGLAGYIGSATHTPRLLHATDSEPVRFYAGNDVVFEQFKTVALPKAVSIRAGNNVVDPNLVVQNVRGTDVSVISAGGDIRYTEPVPNPDGSIPATIAGIQISGPGRLHLLAGRDVDLGSSQGVRSVGDLYNPYLPAGGADIMVNPGAITAPNYAGMIAAYIDPASAGSDAATYLPQLLAYMRIRNSDNGLSSTTALAAFKALEPEQQAEFVNRVFYSELLSGGRQAIDADNPDFGDYSRAQRAILRMFPDFTSRTALANQAGSLMGAFKAIGSEAIAYPGDLKLFYSQIRSERGGRIELLVPGGYINAGLAVAGALKKPATDLGIVSVRGGEILAMVRGDFQVNQSRVFTLGGSDLMLFSALADIDAGRGAKTASATPPPVLRVKDGQVFYDYSGAVSGSGIAALVATGGATGTVDLYAPYGEINAGEAGIQSVGNINLGALVIRNADGITAGGVTAGVPAADTSGLSMGAVGVTDAASAGKSGEQAAQQAQAASQLNAGQGFFLPSFISVEVIGLGDEEDEEKDKDKSKSGKRS